MQRGSTGARVAAGIIFLIMLILSVVLLLTGDTSFSGQLLTGWVMTLLLMVGMFAGQPWLALAGGGMYLARLLPGVVDVMESLIETVGSSYWDRVDSEYRVFTIGSTVGMVLVVAALVFFLLAVRGRTHAKGLGCTAGALMLIAVILDYVLTYAVMKYSYTFSFPRVAADVVTILYIPAYFLSGFAMKEWPGSEARGSYAPQRQAPSRAYEAYNPQPAPRAYEAYNRPAAAPQQRSAQRQQPAPQWNAQAAQRQTVQRPQPPQPVQRPQPPADTAPRRTEMTAEQKEELSNLRNLLDTGEITQQEYDRARYNILHDR